MIVARYKSHRDLQVRTLLNDYITDEEQGVASGRNPISSINEVLREGKYTRDRTKVGRLSGYSTIF